MSGSALPGVDRFHGYDNPRSHFARRLPLVQESLANTLSELPPGPSFVLDICGGEGRVLLPVLAEHPRRADIAAALIEFDATSAARARDHAAQQGLTNVEVRVQDAGLSDSYAGLPRASVVILSGVLVHVAPAGRRRLFRFLRQVCTPDAVLIWTAGNHVDPTRLARIRRTVRNELGPLERSSQVRIGPADVWVRHEIAASRLTHGVLPLRPGQRVFAMRDPVARRLLPRPLRRLLTRLLRQNGRPGQPSQAVR